MRVRSKTDAWVLGVVAAGAALVGFSLTRGAGASTSTLALLAAAVVLTELMQVAPDPVEAHAFSFSSGVHVAAVLVAGPWAAALLAAGGVATVDSMRGFPPRFVAYNASVFALAAAAGGLAFEAAGGDPGVLALPHDLPRVLLLATVAFAVNSLLVGTVIALSRGASLRQHQLEKLRSEMSAVAGEAGLGLALAVLVVSERWAIVALVPLVYGVYQAHARLSELRAETARALETFANVVDERDPSTYRHSERVAELVGGFAERLGLPASQIARLRRAGRLHDLGKIVVDGTSLRRPGKLTEAEWTEMRRHPRLSARLLRRFRFAAAEAQAVEYHHERYDGHGYYGAGPNEVPTASHFLVVADSYDAMVNDRPYRRGLPQEDALAEIERGAGTQFHPSVARAFVAAQRGLDPVAVLTRAERQELRRAGARDSALLRSVVEFVRRPLTVPVAGLVSAIGGVGAGSIAVTAIGTAVCVAALARRVHVSRAARRLGRELGRSLRGTAPASILDELATTLDTAAGVTWAAVVSWSEDEAAGRVVRSWGAPAAAPNELALTTWLAREADSTAAVLVARTALAGREIDVAVPLNGRASRTAYLVLRFLRWPRHVELALAAAGDELAALAAVALDRGDQPHLAVVG